MILNNKGGENLSNIKISKPLDIFRAPIKLCERLV